MLKPKLETAIKASDEGQLNGNEGLRLCLVNFCNYCLTLLPDRNSAVHSTYNVDDDGIMKWDNSGREEPSYVTIDKVNADAQKLRAATDVAVQHLIDIRDYRSSGIVLDRHRVGDA